MTTTIEHVYAALRGLLTDFGAARGYSPSADPFSFDLDPRGGSAFYIDPPLTTSAGLIGDVESVQAQITIWVSREAASDAAGSAVALAGDLARLRHAVVGLDVAGVPTDVNIHEDVATQVQPRGDGAVTVVGACRVSLDYLATAEHP